MVNGFKFNQRFSSGLPFGIIGEGRSNSKTNGVPNLLHIEIKKNPINSTHVKLIGLNKSVLTIC